MPDQLNLTDGAAVGAVLAKAMRDASICGLGQTASSAIESAVAQGLFEEARTPKGSP